MKVPVFYTEAPTRAIAYAAELLQAQGLPFSPAPTKAVTHLLLGVPSFRSDGSLPGCTPLDTLLESLQEDAVLIGGNLAQVVLPQSRKIDLLENQGYLAQNAAITAHCAVRVAMEHFPGVMQDCKVLVIGWGRIGKCLAALLRSMGADVRIAARKEADRAIASALGYAAAEMHPISEALEDRRMIFNTVPAPVVSAEALGAFPKNCLKIDLASQKGIQAEDVIWARGLPGRLAPEASGALIAKTIIKEIQQKGMTL